MENLKPNVLNYKDYRQFLRDLYLFRKVLAPQWGFIQWAQELNVKCPSLLNMVVKGRRHASRELTETLIVSMGLSEAEGNHFRSLVSAQRMDYRAGGSRVVSFPMMYR